MKQKVQVEKSSEKELFLFSFSCLWQAKQKAIMGLLESALLQLQLVLQADKCC